MIGDPSQANRLALATFAHALAKGNVNQLFNVAFANKRLF